MFDGTTIEHWTAKKQDNTWKWVLKFKIWSISGSYISYKHNSLHVNHWNTPVPSRQVVNVLLYISSKKIFQLSLYNVFSYNLPQSKRRFHGLLDMKRVIWLVGNDPVTSQCLVWDVYTKYEGNIPMYRYEAVEEENTGKERMSTTWVKFPENAFWKI